MGSLYPTYLWMSKFCALLHNCTKRFLVFNFRQIFLAQCSTCVFAYDGADQRYSKIYRTEGSILHTRAVPLCIYI